MSTLKVEAVSIDSILPHPNADRLELATVRGWQCVVQKGIWKAGDVAIYIPIDSIVPLEVESLIFPPESKVKLSKSRVKTIKLRGAYSQGLLVSFSDLQLPEYKVGTDLTHKLGITKYEPPLAGSPCQMGKSTRKQVNPHFRKYTDIENFKNHPKLFVEGEPVVVREKLHGTNFRAGWVKSHADCWWKRVLAFFNLLPKWEFVFGSHNVQLQNKWLAKTHYDKNWYAKAVHDYNLREVLDHGEVVYGEIIGPNIQKGFSYGIEDRNAELVVFDLMQDGVYLSDPQFETRAVALGLVAAPLIYSGPYDAERIRSVCKGPSIYESSQSVMEGGVLKPLSEVLTYMGRKILKVINDDYLMLDTTEHH